MLRLLTATLCLLVLISGPASRSVHAAGATAPAMSRVFVRLSGPPAAADLNLRVQTHGLKPHLQYNPRLAASRAYRAQLQDYQSREIDYLRAHGVDLSVDWTFQTVFDGFSADVPTAQLGHLSHLTNVSAVVPVGHVVPQLDQSVGLVKATQAWTQLGGQANAGHGIYIADIDTGIDMKNACFRDTGFAPPGIGHESNSDPNAHLTNNKVVRIRAFGSHAGQSLSADDTVGHGTFTASVEACDANTATPVGTKISGVAPGAYLMSYNIQPAGDDGTGFNDPALAAFEAATEDGADVINYSYGSIFGAGDEREDPYTQAINTIVRAGVPVVISAGNGGPTVQSVSSPSTADAAISVGASTNTRAYTSTAEVTGTGVPSSLQRVPAREGSHGFDGTVGPASLVYVGYGRRPKDDTNDPKANDFKGLDLHGKIALIQRGDQIPFETKINNAAKAGAIGALVFDNVQELDPIGMSVGTATLPAMGIRLKDGQTLLAQIQAHPDTQVLFQSQKQLLQETPDILSDFSARGYGPSYRIKPDLIAPGQDIYAATETGDNTGEMYDKSGFTLADGTSFSGPHVAGGVALLLQKHNWTPADIKAALIENASTTALTDPGNPNPPVMDVGGGLMDVNAALLTKADILPSSVSLGQVNVGYGGQNRTAQVQLKDLGGGNGNWKVDVRPIHTAAGITITAPGAVDVASGKSATVALQFGVSTSVKAGDYDGYIWATNGDQSLHVPYFLHVATEPVAQGSVLLVDATASRFRQSPTSAPIPTKDVSGYYKKSLTALKKHFTLWNIAKQGSPSLIDMKRASAVIYFTGDNLNGYTRVNGDFQDLFGPIGPIDMTNLHDYLDAGGRAFVTGLAAGLSDPVWSLFVLGASVNGLSIYDSVQNDKNHVGGVSPPKPSAVVDRRPDNRENPWLFTGLKPIDISTKGDGAKTNVAVTNSAVGDIYSGQQLVGVSAIKPFAGNYSGYGSAFGAAVLRTSSLKTAAFGEDVGMVNSDEPTLKHKTSYKGRSVYFSFDFAGINNNTGYATREQVLKRIFQWFADSPKAHVTQLDYVSKKSVLLRAAVKSSMHTHAVSYTWEIGKQILKTTKKPTAVRFAHAGTYRVRVQLTDSLGHNAVSAWTNIRVH